MTQRDLFEKIQNGETLDARESLMLEQALEADDSKVSDLMGGLEDPRPSLAWRSELNSRLQEMAPKPSRRPVLWFGSSLVAASVLTVVILLGVNASVPQKPDGVEQVSTPVATNDAPAADTQDIEVALIRAHFLDDAEVSAGLHSPQMVADSGYDWSSL